MKNIFTVALILVSVSLFCQQNKPVQSGNLPANFPVPEILYSDEPSDGYFFLSPAGVFGNFEEATPYLVIMDNHGVPIFYQEQTSPSFDFKVQADSTLSYADGTISKKHHALNYKFEFIKDYSTDGYVSDFHDIQVFDDGSYLVLAKEYRVVDMDTVVEGGHEGVTIIDGVIRLYDINENLLFHWSTRDHFNITDTRHEDLLDPNHIDYAHINSIEKDGDTAIIFSSRNMDEVTKISINTGEIIWRLGGNNNQFTFEDDSIVFSAQHDARITSDGYYSLFDNNWVTTLDHESREIIYDLDEENMTASLVRDIRSRPDPIHGWIMGNGQELENGGYIVGWGSGDPNVTEFKADNTKAFEVRYDAVSYRAYKFDWKPLAFTFDSDEVDFGSVNIGETKVVKINLTNNRQGGDAQINYIHHYDEQFSVLNPMPINLPSGTAVEIEFAVEPGEDGIFEDLFTLCWDAYVDGLSQRIATQIKLSTNVINDISVDDTWKELIQLYPNPVEDYLLVDLSKANVTVDAFRIIDAFGREVHRTHGNGMQKVQIELGHLPESVYILVMETDAGVVSRKIIKH